MLKGSQKGNSNAHRLPTYYQRRTRLSHSMLIQGLLARLVNTSPHGVVESNSLRQTAAAFYGWRGNPLGGAGSHDRIPFASSPPHLPRVNQRTRPCALIISRRRRTELRGTWVSVIATSLAVLNFSCPLPHVRLKLIPCSAPCAATIRSPSGSCGTQITWLSLAFLVDEHSARASRRGQSHFVPPRKQVICPTGAF